MYTPLTAVALALAIPVQAQDHQGCPMKSDPRRQVVDHRHEGATGIISEAAEHHFALASDGGSITLEARGGSDTATRDQVRAHLRHIARAFAAGDFALPARIHDEVPPGVETMKARRSAIRYTFSETPLGGRVSITTADQEARAAVHEFLRFQIRDHGTGDPVE
jgi:hypothetical protein